MEEPLQDIPDREHSEEVERQRSEEGDLYLGMIVQADITEESPGTESSSSTTLMSMTRQRQQREPSRIQGLSTLSLKG